MMELNMTYSIETSLGQSMLPGVVQVFGLIAIGYFFGRCGILPRDSAKGMCVFLQNLSLPVLIFTSLATISFANIEWKFIAAILVAKATVFILVALITMLLTKPTDLGKSGLYAIAATQSNDLALGYPLIFSLYKDKHNLMYASILYVIVPIQLLILNPVGIFMMEANKYIKRHGNNSVNSPVTILKSILSNPIIIMTALGIICNFVFHHTIHPIIGNLLDAIGSVFSTLALFVLGHCMSESYGDIRNSYSLSPALIVLAKIAFLPLLLQKIVTFFMNGSKNVIDFSNLGFLYGTIPCAPTAFIFAKQYQISESIIASSTIYSTIFSAPLMMTSGAVISVTQHGFKNIDYYIKETISYVGVINLVACSWLLMIFIARKRWKDICFLGTAYLIIAQTLMSIGAVLLFFASDNSYLFYAHYFLSFTGLILTMTLTVFLSFLIFLLQWRSLCYVLRYRYLICVSGFVIPSLFSIILSLCLMWLNDRTQSPIFQFGKAQISAVLAVSLSAFFITVVFLIFQHRHMRFNHSYTNGEVPDHLENNLNSDNENGALLESHTKKNNCVVTDCCSNMASRRSSAEASPFDIEDIGNSNVDTCRIISQYGATEESVNTIYDCFCDLAHSCSMSQRQQCATEVIEYQRNSQREVDINLGNHFVKYLIFLLYLCSSIAVCITVCVSSLVTEKFVGVLVELQFLNIILQNSQGILCLFLFGYDSVVIRKFFMMLQRIKNCWNTSSD